MDANISIVETGELKTLVVQSLRELCEASVHDIIDYITNEVGREYAYSTIATILGRLEEEDIVKSEKKRKQDRKKTYYRISSTAHEEEASAFLRDYISKFGDIGIRHLGDMMGSEINEKELDALRKKILDT